jgi:hypothetical protein
VKCRKKGKLMEGNEEIANHLLDLGPLSRRSGHVGIFQI